jgi:hypothetical protein
MKRALCTRLVLVGLLAAGCQLKPAKLLPSAQTAAETVPEAVATNSAPTPAESAPQSPSTNPAEWTEDPLSQPAATAPASDGRVRIVNWDFGTIAPGATAHHRFTITNNDSRTWTVRNVTPTCACTLGEFTPRVLKPAATGSLDVDFRAGAKQAMVAKTILVEFKEPNTPVFQLVVQGEVSDSLSALPAAVKFGRVASGTGAAPVRTVEVHNSSAQDVAFTKVEAPEWVQVEYQPVEGKAPPNATRQRWTLQVRADPGRLRPGLHTATVVIHTDGPGLEPLRIPVGLYLNGPIEPIPGHLTFEPVASGKTVQKNVFLEVAPDLQGISVEDLEFTHNFGDELEVPAPRRVAANRFLVTARFRPRRSPGKVQGELVIRVKGQDVEPARVKVFGEVR